LASGLVERRYKSTAPEIRAASQRTGRIGVGCAVFALLSVVFALAYGPPYRSLLRYSSVIFPLYIVIARFTRSRPGWDQAFTIAGALLQGFLMGLWSNSSYLTVSGDRS
jgi:hypothetical protein